MFVLMGGGVTATDFLPPLFLCKCICFRLATPFPNQVDYLHLSSCSPISAAWYKAAWNQCFILPFGDLDGGLAYVLWCSFVTLRI